MAKAILTRGISWAGLVSGPLSWVISTQANYALVELQCANGMGLTHWVAFAAALIAALGACLSLPAWLSAEKPPAPPHRLQTRRFVAAIGFGAGLLFALITVMQGVAAVIFTGCER